MAGTKTVVACVVVPRGIGKFTGISSNVMWGCGLNYNPKKKQTRCE